MNLMGHRASLKHRAGCGNIAVPPLCFVLLLVVAFLALTMPSNGQLASGDIQALELIARHWPALTNPAIQGAGNWSGNFSYACTAPFVGVNCVGQHVYQLTFDPIFGAENVSDVLPSLDQLFSSTFLILNFNSGLSMSAAAQSSLFTSTLTNLAITGFTGSTLGSFASLTNLILLTLTNSGNVTSLPSLQNCIGALNLFVANCASLTSIQGSFAPSMRALTLASAPALTTLPALFPASLRTLVLSSLNISAMPTLPSSIQSVSLSAMPYLNHTLPQNLSACIQLDVLECPLLVPSLPTLNASGLLKFQIADWPINSIPESFCQDASSPPITIFAVIGTLIPSLPTCLANFTQLTQVAIFNNINLATVPPQLFQLTKLQQLQLYNNSALTSNLTTSGLFSAWNLVSLTALTLSGDLVANGIPTSNSLLGPQQATTANFDVLVNVVPVNGPLSDTYLQPFINATSLSINSLNLTGPIPASLTNFTRLHSLSLSSNSLAGALPPGLLQMPTLESLILDNNRLNGTLPSNPNSYLPYGPLAQLQLGSNLFDVCGSNFSFPSRFSICMISGVCYTCPPPPSTYCIVLCDESPPVSPSLSCGTPPSSDSHWYCTINGWASWSSISSDQPLSASLNLTVQGNLSAPVIVIGNTETTVNVSGCINTTSITLNLTQSEVDQYSSTKANLTLLVQNGIGCPSTISSIPISISTPTSCQHVTFDSYTSSNPSTLVAMFLVDTSGCSGGKSSLWWIILASVVGGVLLLVGIAATLVALVPALRYRIRPHARTKRA